MKRRTLVCSLLPLLTIVVVAAIAFAQLWASHAAASSNNSLTISSCPTEATLIADIATVGPGGTIVFSISSPCTISLTATLVISQNLTLDNQGQQVTLDGGGSLEDFQVSAQVILTLNALTIANGNAQDGGGLFAAATSTVHISNSTFGNNSAQFGGGLFADSGSRVTISNSTFGNNSAQLGGGLFAQYKNTVNISNSTFTKNSAQFGAGLLANQKSTVNISNTTFTNDSAQFGGDLDIDTANSANISNTSFTNDSAQFGAGLLINATGTVRISKSTFANDSAQFGAGLYAHNGSKVHISNSTFANNLAQFGAGLFADSGVTVDISNSTFASNSVTATGSSSIKSAGRLNKGQQNLFTFNAPTLSVQDGSGGGLFANQKSTVNVSNSTFANNSATSSGGGFFNNGGRLRIGQSIVANNTSGGNCSPSGSSIDMGYNLSDDSSCGFTAAKHSLSNTNPQLDPAGLANNGGPTQTIALLPASPAIDNIPTAVCLVTTDQRRLRRPDSDESRCDIGAYESR